MTHCSTEAVSGSGREEGEERESNRIAIDEQVDPAISDFAYLGSVGYLSRTTAIYLSNKCLKYQFGIQENPAPAIATQSWPPYFPRPACNVMRSASGRFGLGLGRSNKESSERDGEAISGHGRVASGGASGTTGMGAGDLAKSVKGKIAHTTIVRPHAYPLGESHFELSSYCLSTASQSYG